MKTRFKCGELLVRADSANSYIYRVKYIKDSDLIIGYMVLATPKGFHDTFAVHSLTSRLRKLPRPLRLIRSNELFWYSLMFLKSKWEQEIKDET